MLATTAKQHLSRTDVAGGALPADVLFARLQGEPIGGASHAVVGHAHDAARQLPLVLVAGGQEGRVRSPETQGDAQALARTHCHVRPELARWPSRVRRQEIGGYHHQSTPIPRPGDQLGRIGHGALGGGILEQETEVPIAGEVDLIRVRHFELDPERRGAGAEDRDGLRMTVTRYHERGPSPARDGPAHGHGFGCRRGFVEQGCIGEREARQIRHHGLEVEERLEAPLRDLGLIGGVLRVPPGVLEYVALDHGRSERRVVARADQRTATLVLGAHPSEGRQRLVFARRLGRGRGGLAGGYSAGTAASASSSSDR